MAIAHVTLENKWNEYTYQGEHAALLEWNYLLDMILSFIITACLKDLAVLGK